VVNIAIRRIILNKSLPDKELLAIWRDLEQAFFVVFDNPMDGAENPLVGEAAD
jgi:hypothetical protein